MVLYAKHKSVLALAFGKLPISPIVVRPSIFYKARKTGVLSFFLPTSEKSVLILLFGGKSC